MKHLLITTIAAVLVVGCGESQPPELPTAKALDISIHEAAVDGNIEAVKQHLAAGTDVSSKDNRGRTPLHEAAHNDHKEIVELLIASGADVNAKDHGLHYTALHFAAIKIAATKEITELLITKGADVNAKGVDGSTPLHVSAVMKGRKETAELLIANGADVNANDSKRRTPLDMAFKSGHKETVDLLRKHGSKTGAELSIHVAAAVGNIEAVKQHLADGADVNAKMEDGTTPLDIATHPDNPNASAETADLLRKHGGKTGEELKAEEAK